MKKFLALFLACILLLATAACSSPAPASSAAPAGSAKPASSQVLKIAHKGNPTSLCNLTVQNVSVNGPIQYMLYDTLVFYDNDTDSFKPMIATKWETVNDKTYKFTLRSDVKAHDGSPMTAKDVIYTLNTGMKSGKLDAYYNIFDLPNCKAENDTTVIIATKSIEPYLFYTLANNALSIVSETAVNKAGGLDSQTRKPTAGSGPYKFVSWEDGQKVVLARNENYWGPKPYFDTVEWRIITDASARLMNLESGDVNMVLDVDLSQIKTVASNKKVQIVNNKTKNCNMGLMNCQKPFFADVKVRQAMALALDYKSIAQVSMGDYGYVTDGVMPNMMAGYAAPDSSYTNYYHYDLAAAKKLLSESSYPNGFSFTLKYMENAIYTNIVQLVQNQLAQLNIKVTLAPTASTVFYNDASAGNFDMYLASPANPDPFNNFRLYDGRLTFAQANGGCGWKGGDQLYSLMDNAKNTLDVTKRNDLLKQAQAIMNSNVPALALGSANKVVAMDADLQGLKLTPFADIYVATASRK